MAQRTHPHAEATYRVIPTDDGAFAVEVSIPETHPATVSPFATEADAEAWTTEHRRRVQYSKPVWPMVSQLRQDELSLLGLKRIGLLSAASAPFAQQPGTPQPPGTPRSRHPTRRHRRLTRIRRGRSRYPGQISRR